VGRAGERRLRIVGQVEVADDANRDVRQQDEYAQLKTQTLADHIMPVPAGLQAAGAPARLVTDGVQREQVVGRWHPANGAHRVLGSITRYSRSTTRKART